MKHLNVPAFTLPLTLLLMAAPAMAHTEPLGSGFLSGFAHPMLGWDHIAAMVAVGLWGAFLGTPAIWVLPVVFPLVMAFGGAIGVLGVPIPAVEAGIALSSVVLGLLIAFACRAPLWLASVLVGMFAILHGHAHGTELPGAVSPLSFAIGFVAATGLLHLLGIVLGLLIRRPAGRLAVRSTGAAIAAVGCVFLYGAV